MAPEHLPQHTIFLRPTLATLVTFSPGYSEQPDVEPDTLQKQADHCNDRRMASKRVQELSIGLFFAVLVKVSVQPGLFFFPFPSLLCMEHQCRPSLGGCHGALFLQESGPLESEAMVMGVLNQAFDVLVLRFGVQKRIYCNVSVPGVCGRHTPTGRTKL